jgi:hypothetical protein
VGEETQVSVVNLKECDSEDIFVGPVRSFLKFKKKSKLLIHT